MSAQDLSFLLQQVTDSAVTALARTVLLYGDGELEDEEREGKADKVYMVYNPEVNPNYLYGAFLDRGEAEKFVEGFEAVKCEIAKIKLK